MSKASEQVRFQLRPTVVGQAIAQRLDAQGVDRAAEARRWIELGFAAEQAGFRLDGVELRHADRAWNVQPALRDELPKAQAVVAPVPSPAAVTIVDNSTAQLSSAPDLPAPPPRLTTPVAGSQTDSPPPSQLMAKMRSLSA